MVFKSYTEIKRLNKTNLTKATQKSRDWTTRTSQKLHRNQEIEQHEPHKTLHRNQEIEQHEPHKSYTEIKRLNNTHSTTKTGGIVCYRSVFSFWLTSVTHRVSLDSNLMISHEREKDRIWQRQKEYICGHL